MTRHFALLSCCVAFTCILAGCDEDVAAPVGLDEPYSIYGILNPRLDTQTVAVSPIEPLLYDHPEFIDARVTSTDMQTGETHAWRDSVVIGERGQRDHVFVADFRARFGSSYRVTVARSDGAATSAVASVPEEVKVGTQEAGFRSFYVNTQGREFTLNGIDVLYTVRLYEEGNTRGVRRDSAEAVDLMCGSSEYPPETYAVSYTGKDASVPGGYRFDVDLGLDHSRVLGRYQFEHKFPFIPYVNGMALLRLDVRLIVGETAWDPPGGEFDANALAQPGTMTNVENGFGFVGGGYNHEARIFPSKVAVDSSLFFDFIQRPPEDCLDFCACRHR